MWRLCALCATELGQRSIDAINGIYGLNSGGRRLVTSRKVCIRPRTFFSTILPTRFSRLASRFKHATGVNYAPVALGLVVLFNGGQLGDAPVTARLSHGVSATASVTPQLRLQHPDGQRLVETLLATEGHRNLAPEYKAWVAADAVHVLQKLPLEYRQALVENAQVLVETARPGVPQLMSYYVTFAAAVEVGAETGWFEVRVNPRRRIKVKVWQTLNEANWKFIEWRVNQLLDTPDGLPEELAIAMGRKKSRRGCTSASRYAEELGINFPRY